MKKIILLIFGVLFSALNLTRSKRVSQLASWYKHLRNNLLSDNFSFKILILFRLLNLIGYIQQYTSSTVGNYIIKKPNNNSLKFDKNLLSLVFTTDLHKKK